MGIRTTTTRSGSDEERGEVQKAEDKTARTANDVRLILIVDRMIG
jgi:hypothetical protein